MTESAEQGLAEAMPAAVQLVQSHGVAGQQAESDEGGSGRDVQEELTQLFGDVQEQQQRFANMQQQAARDPQQQLAAQMYGEFSGTVLTLFADMISTVGGALQDMEERIADVEQGDQSYLTDEDAQMYLACFEQVIRLLDTLEPTGEEQRVALERIRKLVSERMQYTREIGGLTDATASATDDDAGDTEKQE